MDVFTRLLEPAQGKDQWLFQLYHLNSDLVRPRTPYFDCVHNDTADRERYDRRQEQVAVAYADIEPFPERAYTERISLPAPVHSHYTLEELAQRRSTLRTPSKHTLSLAETSYLLKCSAGLQDGRPYPAGAYPPRVIPSAGGLYPLECYVLALDAEGLDRHTFYHYAVQDHGLGAVGASISAGQCSDMFFGARNVIESSMVFVVTAQFRRTVMKYGERAYRYLMIETGALLEQLSLAAEAIGLKAVMLGGYVDSEISAVLNCNGDSESVLLCAAVGRESS